MEGERWKLLQKRNMTLCRSILTTPWVELGGKTQIRCEESGYSAKVEFHTKPFYGGAPHRITAEVFRPADSKPFIIIKLAIVHYR